MGESAKRCGVSEQLTNIACVVSIYCIEIRPILISSVLQVMKIEVEQVRRPGFIILPVVFLSAA